MFEDVDPVRRRMMAAVKSKDTCLEMRVRRRLHAMGYRYVLHDRRLAGKPDLAFPSRRKAVFLHGCFWHLHEGCPKARMPRTRVEFWEPKLMRNRERDASNEAALVAMGWQVLTVWECAVKGDETHALDDIRDFLSPPGRTEDSGA